MKRIGLHVGQNEITAVIVERGKVIWSAATPLQADSGAITAAHIAVSLGALLSRLPRDSWRTQRVTTAFGLPWGRVKLVKGVPAISRRRELVSMLRLSTNRFVASTRPVIITGAIAVADGSDGEICIGIADVSLMEAVTRAITAQKLRVGCIVPAAAIKLVEETLEMRDADPAYNGYETGIAIAARIAGADRSLKLGLRPSDNPAAIAPDTSRRRVTVAAGCLVAAGLVYFGSQLNIERQNVTRDRLAIHKIAVVSDSVAREDADLGHLNRDLISTTSFARRRISTALLLGAITQALPAEAAITTLRIDTTTVDVVTLSPRTAAVIDALADVPSLATPTIIGPVSRETVGPRELERATIRLHIVPDLNRAKIRFEVEREQDR
jgi:hypothetical protein